MKIEPLGDVAPKVERPMATGAAVVASVEHELLSNDPETPVQPVAEVTDTTKANTKAETVWSESDRRAVFRVMNEHTGEVVAQIPTDEVLRVTRNIDELVREEAVKSVDLET